jgi:peptide/nickel transport system permease protein
MVFLFGGDKLARDVFSRMVYGSRIVLIIAPAATAFALMVGATLGLPAGYYGGRIDSDPVVPRQPRAGLPGDPAVLPAGDAGHHGHADPLWSGGVFFLFPIIFF